MSDYGLLRELKLWVERSEYMAAAIYSLRRISRTGRHEQWAAKLLQQLRAMIDIVESEQELYRLLHCKRGRPKNWAKAAKSALLTLDMSPTSSNRSISAKSGAASVGSLIQNLNSAVQDGGEESETAKRAAEALLQSQLGRGRRSAHYLRACEVAREITRRA